jgi:hypothetical protein
MSRWGRPSPLHTITLNGRPFDIQPNLHKALRYLRRSLTGNFWVDAVCINQQNDTERTQQVRAMSETYGNASMVAAWIGPCDDVIRPLFQVTIQANMKLHERRPERNDILKACEALATRRYWTRIWIQQEMLLQTKVTLFCGDYHQPLYPLIDWFRGSRYGRNNSNDFFSRLSMFRDMLRRPTLLEIVTYFSACESKDRRDKIFALISLVEGPEQEALMEHLPNYRLSLGEVIKIVLRHIRKFSGQKRCARQLDSILYSLGEPGDTLCGRASFKEHINLRESAKAGRDPRRTITAQEMEKFATSFVLYGELSWLEIFRCIFRSPNDRGQGGVETWVLDPDLPRARENHLLEME